MTSRKPRKSPIGNLQLMEERIAPSGGVPPAYYGPPPPPIVHGGGGSGGGGGGGQSTGPRDTFKH